MYASQNDIHNCVQRWFAELMLASSYGFCRECRGLIVNLRSNANPRYYAADSPCVPGLLRDKSRCPTPKALSLEEGNSRSEHPRERNVVADRPCPTGGDHTTPISRSEEGSFAERPAEPDRKTDVIQSEEERDAGPQRHPLGRRRSDPATDEMARLRDFHPGFIRPAARPCSACRRAEGPRHPTGCPGCTADYLLNQRENPPRPSGYIGKRPPYGLAGWRVARGHRQPKPVTLHGYGCFMQRKPHSYGGKYADHFTHLGEPPSILVHYSGCSR